MPDTPMPDAPRISRQLESSLFVAHLDRSADFYKRVFGFGELLREDRMIGLAVPCGAVLLLFRRFGSVEPSQVPNGVIPPHDGQGALHLCFAIPLAELQA